MSALASIKRFLAFLGEVRAERRKITWPKKQEVIGMTVVVFVLAIVAALFFSVVDTMAFKLVHSIIGR
ncbi:MAG: preprotein translocase subunit SecE [Holosporales bacterium]|jgi:preprotein translocase subunit SecE|nr:preprotein translocase subunit SecE [Holosporales bacterium]